MVPPPHVLLAVPSAFHEFAYDVGEQRVHVANLSLPEVGALHNIVCVYVQIIPKCIVFCQQKVAFWSFEGCFGNYYLTVGDTNKIG